jgi:hypothetical protein
MSCNDARSLPRRRYGQHNYKSKDGDGDRTTVTAETSTPPPPPHAGKKSIPNPRQEKVVSVKFCLSLKGCFVRSRKSLFVLPDCTAVVAAPSMSYATVGIKVADRGSLSAFGTAFPFPSPLLQVPVHRALRYLSLPFHPAALLNTTVVIIIP